MSEFYDTRSWSDPAAPLPFDKWPNRLSNALEREGITTWGQLLSKTRAQLWRIPGLGPLSLKQLQAFIQEYRQ